MLGLGDLEVRGKCIHLNSLPHPNQDDPYPYQDGPYQDVPHQ